jgi:hypothetical protein
VSISVVKCSWVKCGEVLLQCSDGTSNKVSDIIRRHTDNRELLLTCICILLLSYSFIFFRFYFFYQYVDVFLFNTVIYMLCLCILIV